MRDIRIQIFEHFQTLQMSYFDKNPVGRLMTRITSDVDAIGEFLSGSIVTVLSNIFTTLFTFVMLFSLDYRLAFITITVMPFMLGAMTVFAHYAQKLYRDVKIKMAKVNAFLQESITGVMDIQVANRQKVNQRMCHEVTHELFVAQLRSIVNYTLFFQSIDLLETVALGLLIWYGSKLILINTLTEGLVVAFAQYVREFYGSIHEISDRFNDMQTAMASSERIFTVLDEKITITEKPDALEFPGKSKGEVSFEGVHFAYNPGAPVLKGIDFEVKQGEKIALVGPTGAGKSSIISLLSRLYDIQTGDIKIDGHSIYDLTLDSLRRQISVVLQHPFIFSGPLIENITMLSPISREQAKDAARLVGAEDFILKLPDGYDTIMTERGSTLSVGQRQLLSFARAIAHDPSILVLDEATSSIDTASEMLIQEAMQRMMSGRTSIVIAHRLSTIKDANQVLVIGNGKIVERGTHDQLLRMDGVYKRLYELQFKGQEA